jgi:hypothetical protein
MKRATDAELEFADDYGMMAIQLLWSIYVETGNNNLHIIDDILFRRYRYGT